MTMTLVCNSGTARLAQAGSSTGTTGVTGGACTGLTATVAATGVVIAVGGVIPTGDEPA
jgi:hypothetical protein